VTFIAAVDRSTRLVLGIGLDRARATRDAKVDPERLEFHEITLEQCKRIANGETSWPLGGTRLEREAS
jgi:hypothetical protein